MSRDPVWITGLGMCTPCGNDLNTVADALLNGRSAIRRVARFDVSQHPSQIAAMVDEIPGLQQFGMAELSKAAPNEHLIAYCAAASLHDADLWDQRHELRVGLIVGIGSEWLINWEINGTNVDHAGNLRVAHEHLGIAGPAVTISAACASGNHAIALACSWLRQGLVDVCLAGGCDMTVTPMTLAGFGNLRALSRCNDAPTQACRPFDRQRDGFVLGEGGVLCALELAASATSSGRKRLAQVLGFGATSDAHHLVIPSPDPSPVARAIQLALAEAQLDVRDIDYINTHGTATPIGDVTEAAALASVFGAALTTTPASSTKSVSGHLLTAAAAFEAVAAIIAMHRSAIPPTINLTDPDPECPLHHVANEAREARIRTVLSNSFGFGGSNTALVLGKLD